MDQETTTTVSDEPAGQTVQGVPIDDQGQAVPQAGDTEATAAAQDTTEAEGTDNGNEAKDEPSEDDTSAWLKKKGIDPSDPDAITKLAKSAREAERNMHKATVKASELEKTAKITDDQVPEDAAPEVRDNVRMRNLELRYDIQQWKLDNQDKLGMEPEMVKVLSDPKKKLLVQEGYLSLDDVYRMAVGGSGSAGIKSQGERAALERLAQKQQAQSPKGNATNPSQMTGETITPQNVDKLVATHDTVWFKAHYDEINKAMAG